MATCAISRVPAELVESFPLRPWARKAPHAFSLGELMKQLNIHVLLDITDDLSKMAAWAIGEPDWLEERLHEDDNIIPESLRQLDDLGRVCADYGFSALFKEIQRNRVTVENRCTYRELSAIAENLGTRLRDEYEDVLLLWIENKQFYRKDNLFGSQVSDRFPAAADDIKEAGTCYALGRYTACIFHLQRVMEVGLKILADPIGESHTPNWDSILKKIDAELKKDWEVRKEFFKGNEQKIADASAMLQAVKTAWRNPTMHVDNIYDEEKALDVWNAVKGFMSSLCTIIAQ
jgi:HEPN domain-containing protein